MKVQIIQRGEYFYPEFKKSFLYYPFKRRNLIFGEVEPARFLKLSEAIEFIEQRAIAKQKAKAMKVGSIAWTGTI